MGTVIPKVALCARSKEVHGDVALATIDKMRGWFSECPWDPVLWRGIPAEPAIPPALAFQEYVLRRSVLVDLIASGRAYTDEACGGLLRRAERAGRGVCCVSEEREILWAVYGVCPPGASGVLGNPPLRGASVVHRL